MFTDLTCVCGCAMLIWWVKQSIYSPLFGFWSSLLIVSPSCECLFCQLDWIYCWFNQVSTILFPFLHPATLFLSSYFLSLLLSPHFICPSCLTNTHTPHPSPSTTSPWLLFLWEEAQWVGEHWMTDWLTPWHTQQMCGTEGNIQNACLCDKASERWFMVYLWWAW